MKKLIKNILKFAPIVLFVIAINYSVDPANLFRDAYVSEVAQIIISGKNVAGMVDCDERSLQQQIVLKERACPKTIIIGSSRVMELSDESIIGITDYRNMGMSGAGVYDYLGITGLFLAEEKQLPQKIIIGIDPWILNANNGDTRYKKLMKYIDFMDQKMDRGGWKLSNVLYSEKSKWFQLFSLSYFRESFNSFVKNPRTIFEKRSIEFYATTEREVPEGIRYADGSTDYPAEYRNKTVEEVNMEAKEYIAGDVYQLEDYTGISEELRGLFIDYLDFLDKNNIEVVFFFPPYHPNVYEQLIKNEKYRIILDVEEYFRNVAEDRNIPVYGSYDPAHLKCTDEDFLDGMHMRRADIYKAWNIVN